MEYYLNGMLVVEGKEDKAFLSNFIKSEILTINGTDFKNNIYVFLQKYAANHTVFVMTDEDESGMLIRNKIAEKGIKFVDIRTVFESRTKGNKKGIAECKKENIIKALDPYFVSKPNKTNLNTEDFYKLGLVGDGSNTNIKKVCLYFELPIYTGKKFRLMINQLGIGKDELKSIIEL